MLLSHSYGEIKDDKKKEFVNFYKDWSKIEEENPNDTSIKVMFLDANGDGKEEAFATSKMFTYEKNQSDWTGFQMVDGKWEPLRGIGNVEKVIVLAGCVFGRPGEFFRVVKFDGSIEFLILGENLDKKYPQGIGKLYKSFFIVDEKGIIRETKIENIENYLAYFGERKSGLIISMNQIPVEFFPHNPK